MDEVDSGSVGNAGNEQEDDKAEEEDETGRPEPVMLPSGKSPIFPVTDALDDDCRKQRVLRVLHRGCQIGGLFGEV